MWALVIAWLPLSIVAGVFALLLAVIASTLLLLVVWTTWCTRGRYALVVYSSSPIWQEYFETRVLPDPAGRAAVLNWSERKRWPLSTPVLLFRLFGGTSAFNPIAIVFAPFRWPRRCRFYRAFRSFKHGRPEEVDALRKALLQLVNDLAKSR
jgi:hypothetical protein